MAFFLCAANHRKTPLFLAVSRLAIESGSIQEPARIASETLRNAQDDSGQDRIGQDSPPYAPGTEQGARSTERGVEGPTRRQQGRGARGRFGTAKYSNYTKATAATTGRPRTKRGSGPCLVCVRSAAACSFPLSHLSTIIPSPSGRGLGERAMYFLSLLFLSALNNFLYTYYVAEVCEKTRILFRQGEELHVSPYAAWGKKYLAALFRTPCFYPFLKMALARAAHFRSQACLARAAIYPRPLPPAGRPPLESRL